MQRFKKFALPTENFKNLTCQIGEKTNQIVTKNKKKLTCQCKKYRNLHCQCILGKKARQIDAKN